MIGYSGFLWHISIHTSTREVTQRWLHCVCKNINFNPHFHKGSDFWYSNSDKDDYISIHTSTREVTVPALASLYESYDFNPHFHKGSDDLTHIFVFFHKISIHTSTREVTLSRFTLSTNDLFQSTLPQGKWLRNGCIYWFVYRFQSTLPQGKWLVLLIDDDLRAIISIHTSTREVTLLQYLVGIYQIFQSTLPQGKWRWKVKTGR